MNPYKIRNSFVLVLAGVIAFAFFGCRIADTFCNHSESLKTVVHEATCTENGSKFQICEKCNTVLEEESLNATGHSYSAFTTVIEPYLEQNGIEERICSACGETDRREFTCEHSSTSIQTFGGYTCPEDAEIKTICVRCSLVLSTTIIEGTNHTYGQWQILIEATPQGEGVRYRECLKCAHIESELYAIDSTE